MNKKSTRSGFQALKIVCTMVLVLAICTNCKFRITPSVFTISTGGENQHEISYELLYVGAKTSTSIKYPTSVGQCPNGGSDNPLYCNLANGQSYAIANPGEIVINDDDSFASLNWNVREYDSNFESFTVHLSAADWNMDQPQCIPYEIRISVNFEQKVIHKTCYSVKLKMGNYAQVKFDAKIEDSIKTNAEGFIGVQLGVGWESCSTWIEPEKSYILSANVYMNSIYPAKQYTIQACETMKIQFDGYGNRVYPYNPIPHLYPDWITLTPEAYIARPMAKDVGNHNVTFGVFGQCGIRQFQTYFTVAPEPTFSDYVFTLDACDLAQLEIKDSKGAIALPSSPGASLSWITYDTKTYLAAPQIAHIGNYTATFAVASLCGVKTVNATIKVQPERQYQNFSTTVKACTATRLSLKNAFGIPIPPSTTPTIPKQAWISSDVNDYIAKPTKLDIGSTTLNLSMFSTCGPRNVLATVIVIGQDNFVIDRKIINVTNADKVSYHPLTFTPSNQVVTCKDFANNNWFSVSETGNITVTPTNIPSGTYHFTGICHDKCGNIQDSAIDIYITQAPGINPSNLSNHADFLFSAGLALVLLVFAMLF